MSRLLTQVAPLAFLLLFAASAQAATFFVDLDGGSDTAFDGSSPTVTGTGNAGPFMTINRALTAAGNNDTIVILASTYNESFTITETNLTLTAFAEGGDDAVRLTGNVTIGTGAAAADAASAFLAAGTNPATPGTVGRFVLNTPNLVLQNGTLSLGGTGMTTIGDGAQVTITRTNGSLTGTPTFLSTANVIYNGNANVTAGPEIRSPFTRSAVNPAGSPRITVALTGGTAADNRTLTLPAAVTLGSGAIVDVQANNRIVGQLNVQATAATTPVTFVGPGRYGSLNLLTGARVNSTTSDISLDQLTLNGTAIFDASGRTVTLFGNFTQNGSGTLFAASSLAFDGAGSYTFTPLSGFTAVNLAIGVGADTNPTVTFGGDASITGTFTVAPTATAALGGNLVNIAAGGTSDVDGTVSNGAVAFQGIGTIDGLGVYDQILVLNGNVTAAAGANFQFTNQLLLAGGALVSGGAVDVSPLGPNARVFVDVSQNGGNNKITGANFNADNAAFNLAYSGTTAGTYTVGSEFDTEYINNLSVTSSGVVDASGVGITGPANGNDTIDGNVSLTSPTASGTATTTALTFNFPSYNVDIAGNLTVGDDVLAQVPATTGDFTGDLTLLNTTNTVLGTIGGSGRLVLAGGTPGITGSGVNSSANNASTISTGAGLLVAGNAAATITGIRRIGIEAVAGTPGTPAVETQIRDGNTSSSLSLGLARDGAATAFTGAGDVTGSVLLSGAFTLTSDVQFNRALTLNGAVAIGTNDVVFNDATLTLNGQTVAGTTGEFQFVATSTFDPQGASTNVAGATVPGVNVIAPTTLISRVTVINTFRIASTFDADTNDGGTAATDDFLTLAVNGTIALADNAVVVGDTDTNPARREVVLAGAFNFRNEQTQLFSSFAVTLLGSADLITFTSAAGANNYQSLPEVGVGFAIPVKATFNVTNFIQESGRFNLAGRNIEVSGNTTLLGTAPIVNLQGGVPTASMTDAQIQTLAGNVQRNSAADPYSEFRFTGATNGTLQLNGLDAAAGRPGAYVGSGVDLVLNKATETGTVTLAGGALLFDDQFTPAGVAAFVQDTPNDEMFVLQQGVFAMGTDNASRNTLYVNLDHENSLASRQAEATTDNGQGFTFRAPSTSTVPVAQIAGTIQKRIFSDPSILGNDSTPGRVVNPLGDVNGEYAEFTLDFESIARQQSFARRTIRTTFRNASPGGSLGLPIQDGVSPGVAVGATGNFNWLVTSDPTLGADTEFNVEARYDGYTLAGNESIRDLRLVRRQFGNEEQNPFTLVSDTYDNFLIDPTPSNTATRDEEPTVVAENARALLGPQGTLFAYGLRAVAPTNVASFQVINNAVNGGPVDVYVGSTLIANNLAFGEATAYQTVTGVGTTPTSLTVTVASETSTSPAGGRAFTTTASQGATYAVVVFNDGVDANTGDAYDAVIVNTQRTTSASSDTVELLAINGSADAGRIDIGLQNAASPFFRDLQFGEAGIAFQTGLDATLLRFSVSPQGTGTPFFTANLDLSPARGERGLLIAQGLRTTPAGQPTRAFRLIFVRPDGSIITSVNTVATGGTVEIPAEFALRGTAPNPFRTMTKVRFDLPEAAEVQVEVYDALGRRVMQTAPSTMAPGADHGIEVNGNGLAAGLYVYRLTARGESQSWSQTGQITVLR